MVNNLLDISTTAVTVEGTDGYLLLWAFGVVVLLAVVYVIINRLSPATAKRKQSFFSVGRKRIGLELAKDRKYYPDILKADITNSGRVDIDLDQPMLIFRSIWMKRKFRLKGTSRHTFYPLLLEPGKVHTLQIDLNHFYRHDRALKRYPQVSVEVYEVGGKKLSSKSVMLRKTLFR